jgi:hypothetical protein
VPKNITPSEDCAAAAALEDLRVHLLQREAAPPKKGERWDAVDGTNRTCRVMCDPVEGYVMARYKGASPWLLHVNDWHKKFRRHGA